MVRFRAQSVYLAPYFLAYEAKFLSLAFAVAESVEKIVQVIAQTLFLFVNIELLDVEYHLLLVASAVVFHLRYLCESILDAGTYLGDAFGFVFRHFGQ